MRRMLIWGFALVVIAVLGFVRLAPTDVARWHVPIAAREDKDFAGGAIRVIPGDARDLQTLREIASQTPRTRQIAGSVEEGRLTFLTRSTWIGFPDYTTFELTEGEIRMHARLRFGQSDLGVNKARLERWIAALRGA